MTDKALTALTAASALALTDYLYGVVGADSRKITPVVLFASHNLVLETASVLGFRNGATAQNLNVYKTWTSAANNEYLQIGYDGALFAYALLARANSPGATRDVRVGTMGSSPLILVSNSTDQVIVGSGGLVSWGQQSSSYPALKRSTTALQVRLGDDSGYAMLEAGKIGAGGVFSASTFLNLAAGTTAASPLRFVQGAAPTAPVDGDVWREDNTNTGIKIRVNGVTKTVTLG